MPLGIPDTRAFPWDQSLKNHLGQLNNSVTGGINMWEVNPTVGVDGAALSTNHIGYTGINLSKGTVERWSGSSWDTILATYKWWPTAQVNVYISQATGSDSNDGTSSSTAWKTISKMYQELAKYNFLEKQVNVHLGAGNYWIKLPPSLNSAYVHIKGISSTSVNIERLEVLESQEVSIEGVTLSFPTLPVGYPAWYVAIVYDKAKLTIYKDVVLGPIGTFEWGKYTAHIHSIGGYVNFRSDSPISLTGSVTSLVYVKSGGIISFNRFVQAPSITTTLQVSNGNTYTLLPPLKQEDARVSINVVGSQQCSFAIWAEDSSISGNGGTNASITGNLTGQAYRLLNSTFYGTPMVGTITSAANIFWYPSSISPGTADTASLITVPGNI